MFCVPFIEIHPLKPTHAYTYKLYKIISTVTLVTFADSESTVRTTHLRWTTFYFFFAIKTAWTPSLLPSCHGSNSASRAMLTTFSAKPASCSLLRSKMYLGHTKWQRDTTKISITGLTKQHKGSHISRKHSALYSWWLYCHHGNKACYYKNPHLADSTTSTASGAAICLSIGPKWCTQLYSIDGGKQTQRHERWPAVISVKVTRWFIYSILGSAIIIVTQWNCLCSNMRGKQHSPGRKVDAVEEVGVFLFCWQFVKWIQGQECHRDPAQPHQVWRRFQEIQ